MSIHKRRKDEDEEQVYINYLIQKSEIERSQFKNVFGTFQTEINEHHRTKYIEWFLNVCENLVASTSDADVMDTYFLAICIFDRYIQKVKISKNEITFILLCSLSLASVFVDDILIPDQYIMNFVNKKNTLSDFKKLKQEILEKIDYRLDIPNVFSLSMNFLYSLYADVYEQHKYDVIKKCIFVSKHYDLYKYGCVTLAATIIFLVSDRTTITLSPYIDTDIINDINI